VSSAGDSSSSGTDFSSNGSTLRLVADAEYGGGARGYLELVAIELYDGGSFSPCGRVVGAVEIWQ
jgi:hypothetical protein